MSDLRTAIEILCDDPAELRAVLGDVLDHPAEWSIEEKGPDGTVQLFRRDESREQAEQIVRLWNEWYPTMTYRVVPYTIRAAWEDRKRGIR